MCRIFKKWINLFFDYIKLMGKKGKYRNRDEEDQVPKKKTIITEEQLMDKSHMDKTEFTPMMPTQSLYPPFIYNTTHKAAMQKIVGDLNYLLYLNFKQFWATMLYNPTIKGTLTSILAFTHKRWLNQYMYSHQSEQQFESDENNRQHYRIVKDQNIYEFTEGLDQVILFIYHRIVSFNVENKELSIFYKIDEAISSKYLLGVPKLLQICDISGETNQDIVKYIIRMFAKTREDFYQHLTSEIFPHLFKKIEDNLRSVKNQTDRQEYGINFGYKRLHGESLSHGQEQLKKKNKYLLQFISFIEIINHVIQFFPDNCVDFCYFNSTVQYLIQNIFLELQVAYRSWNYQTQQVKMLGLINAILKKCTQYHINYFQRCNAVLLDRTIKVSTSQAYVKSLNRLFKDFGRRSTVSKRNQTRNLLLFKIVQKDFDLHRLVNSFTSKHLQEMQVYEDAEYQFNIDYLREIVITFDNQFKEQEYINQNQPRQQEIEEETQPEAVDPEEIDEVHQLKMDTKEEKELTKKQKDETMMMQMLVPKRQRSEDYYQKLYSDYNSKFYKGQYEDDYDQIADHGKRPLFYEEGSSSSDQQQKNQHLISNQKYLQHINQIHQQRVSINREELRQKNANKPKFGKVQNNDNNQKGKYVEKDKNKDEPVKKRYVEKVQQHVNKEDQYQDQDRQRPAYREKTEQEGQVRGGQGFKKSDKSYKYVPKKGAPDDKGRNTNKTKDRDRRNK